MSSDLGDLLPLFLSEAGERLERLSQLICHDELSSEQARLARRELHALKGATRMMRLTDLSELCHQAEEVLDPLTADSLGRLAPLIDKLADQVSVLANQESSGANGSEKVEVAVEQSDSEHPSEVVPAPEKKGRSEGPKINRDEIRISADLLSRLSDRCVRARVLNAASTRHVETVFQLVRLAERGVNERQPQQVLASLATSLRQVGIELESGQRNLSHQVDRQLDELLSLQVQPLKPFLLGLARHARELARSLGKEVEVTVTAGDSQLDRRIIDALREAFLHLVRNAVDHAIETPEVRLAANKHEHGHIRLEAVSEADRVRIVVTDDGGGIDAVKVASAVVDKGLVSAEDVARLSLDERLQLVCLPGFSTREEASEVSGRGVGLDAVVDAVNDVGGDLVISSNLGQGTTITLQVPVARRGERLLIIKVGHYHVALPSAVIRSYRRITPDMTTSDGGRHFVTINLRVIPIKVLADDDSMRQAVDRVLLEGTVGGTGLALLVDAVVGEEEAFIRPMPTAVAAPDIFDGMAVLASGRPVPVISPQRMVRYELGRKTGSPPLETRKALRILLVDDSHVTREMIRRLLEDGGFKVQAAASAGDALTALSEGEFDCLVTDIEMPGMSGLDLTRHLRDTPQFTHLPIVVVSTLDRPRDRLAGLEAGADAYLTKQGLDARELVKLVARVGGGG